MDLDLEIHPLVVYRQLCKQEDREVDPAVDDAGAAEMEDVMEIVRSRVVKLLEAGDEVLQAIMSSTEEMPYGMRWVCSKLKAECQSRFPKATRYEVGSLIGGYVMLRFFTPA